MPAKRREGGRFTLASRAPAAARRGRRCAWVDGVVHGSWGWVNGDHASSATAPGCNAGNVGVVARRDTAGRAAAAMRRACRLCAAPPQHARHEPTPHPRFARRCSRSACCCTARFRNGPRASFRRPARLARHSARRRRAQQPALRLIGAWAWMERVRGRATMPTARLARLRAGAAGHRGRLGALPLGRQRLARLRPPADRPGPARHCCAPSSPSGSMRAAVSPAALGSRCWPPAPRCCCGGSASGRPQRLARLPVRAVPAHAAGARGLLMRLRPRFAAAAPDGLVGRAAGLRARQGPGAGRPRGVRSARPGQRPHAEAPRCRRRWRCGCWRPAGSAAVVRVDLHVVVAEGRRSTPWPARCRDSGSRAP